MDDDTFGGGVHVAGVLNVGQLIPALGDDYIVASFTWGDGIGRYIINGFNQDPFLDAGGTLDGTETGGAAASRLEGASAGPAWEKLVGLDVV